MKNTIKLLFLGLFLFGITATRAQISTSTGGVNMVLANVPNTNTNVGIAIALNPLGGNVGIGTTTPSAKLDVNGNIAVGGSSAGSDASPLSKKIAAYNYQSIEAGAIDFLDFNTNRHATSIAFRAKNASNVPEEFMRIVGQDGNVGIGTTSPDQKLSVKGKIHAEEIIVDLSVPADYVFQKYYTGKSELKVLPRKTITCRHFSGKKAIIKV